MSGPPAAPTDRHPLPGRRSGGMPCGHDAGRPRTGRRGSSVSGNLEGCQTGAVRRRQGGSVGRAEPFPTEYSGRQWGRLIRRPDGRVEEVQNPRPAMGGADATSTRAEWPGDRGQDAVTRGQEREVKVICFARLCEEDVIKVGSTGDLPSRFLSKLKGKFGPVKEVTWLDDDVEPNEGTWRALDRRSASARGLTISTSKGIDLKRERFAAECTGPIRSCSSSSRPSIRQPRLGAPPPPRTCGTLGCELQMTHIARRLPKSSDGERTTMGEPRGSA